MIRKNFTTSVSSSSSPPKERSVSPGSGDRGWQKKAESAIRELAERGVPFTSEDVVRAVGAPPSPNLLPPLMRAAHRRGLIAKSRAPVAGSLWIGAQPLGRARRMGSGRRREDARSGLALDEHLQREACRQAEREAVSPEDLLSRALRAYLDRPRKG